MAFVTMTFPFHGQLSDLPLENNYSKLCVVVCRHRWLTVFTSGTCIIIGGQSLKNFQRGWRSILTKRHGQYRRFVGSITVLHSWPTIVPRIVRADFF